MPISRMFATAEAAKAAVDDLRQAGFGGSEIYLVSKATGNVSAESIVSKGVSPPHAREYAQRVNQGGGLVVMEAPFGGAARAIEILQRPQAGDSGAAKVVHESLTGEAATPLSSALQMKVLSENPAPLSSFWGLPTLLRQQSPKSSSFGLPLLWQKAAPLSAMIGMKPLSDKAAPLSARLGMKVLTDNPSPLSTKLGLPVLSKAKSSHP